MSGSSGKDAYFSHLLAHRPQRFFGLGKQSTSNGAMGEKGGLAYAFALAGLSTPYFL